MSKTRIKRIRFTRRRGYLTPQEMNAMVLQRRSRGRRRVGAFGVYP
jgi:hypothetical protein